MGKAFSCPTYSKELQRYFRRGMLSTAAAAELLLPPTHPRRPELGRVECARRRGVLDRAAGPVLPNLPQA